MNTISKALVMALLLTGCANNQSSNHSCEAEKAEANVNESEAQASNFKGVIAGHEYVDLGLPSGLLWATCNVGAGKCSEPGDYFAWGETEPKKDYRGETYKYVDSLSGTLVKYNNDALSGTVDNKSLLEKEDDAASVNFGEQWRMPTREEYKELLDGCDWKMSNEGAVRCAIGVSKKNGQEILFPCTGYRTDMNIENILPKDKSNGENNESAAEGYYWSSSLDEFQFFGTYVRISCSEISGIHRDNGFLVRPVASK